MRRARLTAARPTTRALSSRADDLNVRRENRRERSDREIMCVRVSVVPVCCVSVGPECLAAHPDAESHPDASWRRKPCSCLRRCGLVTSRAQCGETPSRP